MKKGQPKRWMLFCMCCRHAASRTAEPGLAEAKLRRSLGFPICGICMFEEVVTEDQSADVKLRTSRVRCIAKSCGSKGSDLLVYSRQTNLELVDFGAGPRELPLQPLAVVLGFTDARAFKTPAVRSERVPPISDLAARGGPRRR